MRRCSACEFAWDFGIRNAVGTSVLKATGQPQPQIARRLANGNTLINNWFNQWQGKPDPNNLPLQAIEVTRGKKVVWALRAWTEPVNLGPSTTFQLLDEPGGISENVRFGTIGN